MHIFSVFGPLLARHGDYDLAPRRDNPPRLFLPCLPAAGFGNNFFAGVISPAFVILALTLLSGLRPRFGLAVVSGMLGAGPEWKLWPLVLSFVTARTKAIVAGKRGRRDEWRRTRGRQGGKRC